MIAPRRVYQFTLDGQLLREYASVTQAANLASIQTSHISNCCMQRGHHQTGGGYLWSYDRTPPTVDNQRRRSVEMVKDGVATTFPSMAAGATHVGTNASTIWKAIKLNRPYKGTTWRYL